MKLPQPIQDLVDAAWEEACLDPRHYLSGDKRVDIIESFNSPRAKLIGDLLDNADYASFPDKPGVGSYEKLLNDSFQKLTPADLAGYWLAILTVDYVLPIYEEGEALVLRENKEKSLKRSQIKF